MITPKTNNPISAIHVNDMAALLIKYRQYMSDQFASESKLVQLLNTPGADRDEFIQFAGADYTARSGRYVLLNL